jgi:hypothetical protein
MRRTKSRFAGCTSPEILNARLRLFDFLVSRWPRVGFLYEIFPVPVILNVFLALECVLTLGMFKILPVNPTGVPEQTGRLWDHLGNTD